MFVPDKKAIKNKIIVYSWVICIGIAFYFMVKNIPFALEGISTGLKKISPFVYGVVIAYLMFIPMKKIEAICTKFLCRKKQRQNLVRCVSISLTFLLTFFVIVLIANVFIPQLIESLTKLIEKMPYYINEFGDMLDKWLEKNDVMDFLEHSEILRNLEINSSSWRNFGTKFLKILQDLLPRIIEFSSAFTNKLFNIMMGIIISIYLLSGKEKFLAQIRKFLYSVFFEKTVKEILRISRLTNHTFHCYITGQLTDALVLGIITFICMIVLRIPLAFIISVLVSIANIIPMIGSILSGVVGFFLILVIDPVKSIWFAVLILILQQIDGNILVPRIVGESTGLSGFWVLVAIFIGGMIGGLPAIVIAVPVMSVCYTLVKERVEKRLAEKELPIDTKAYMDEQ